MKLVYKNFTICSKAEGSIPVCDTTCVPQLQENLMNSTLHGDDRNAAGEYRKEFCTAASTVCVYAAVLRPVSLGYRAGDDGGACKGAAAAGKSCSAGLSKNRI